MRFRIKIKKSLLSQLLISYMLLIVIPASLIGYWSFKASREIIESQSKEYFDMVLMQTSKNVEILVDQIMATTTIFHMNSELEKNLTQQSEDHLTEIYAINEIEKSLANYTIALGWLKHSSVIFGKNGLVYSSGSDTPTLDINTVKASSWYKKLEKSGEKIVWFTQPSGFTRNLQNESVITAVSILKNPISNAPYGILLLTADEKSIYNIYKDFLTDDSIFYIVDEDGFIISNSIRNEVGSKSKNSLYVNLYDKSGHQTVIWNGIEYLSSYHKLENTNWYLVYSVPLNSIIKKVNFLKLKILITSIILLCVSAIIAIIISRKISLPLVKLSKRIKTYKNELSPVISRFSIEDEVRILSSEYENIIEKLENTIHELLIEQDQKRKAELHALQMQINPHFLYNTLNSLKCLVWTNKSHLIEPMIDALVNLLEQTVGREDELISIEEEINNIKNYVYIQETRIGFNIFMNYKLENDLLGCKIPKLLLQPIIENAIFHGIESRKKGSITLICFSKADDIIIEIIDDGVGMSEETVTALLSSQKNLYSSSFSSIGIKNVNDRLKLYFGQKYGLEITSSIGIGTSVIIRMPSI